MSSKNSGVTSYLDLVKFMTAFAGALLLMISSIA